MVKPSQPMMARLRLTTKQVNGGYYKGTRSGSMGFFAKNGSYVIDWKKVRTYVVPEKLKDFKLTPFVTKAMPPTRSKYTKDIEKNGRTITVERAFDGKDYLKLWMLDNGQEVLECERLEREGGPDTKIPLKKDS
ncbi:hypothetical protein VTN96DRAFT_1060 [Rasamsonia emersonii]|uniref:50S ribosomal protein YmL27 n=1 Tax=Rasamsonia emersonii (strain ATCC 16479 / CBS 393.64 / IMI 116815) TaxID=1408163 RepID=A0A0F4YML1_RASE3|nr:50S ribosomal protein YmL27 [Rasamsonia emersonii CBS 393.64]KKA19330.1 50S ribosomal protein YmL27 [Rasamsonia emersonii CBS 393.64]